MLDEKGLKYTMIFEGGYLLVVIAALGAAAGALERGGLGSHGIWVFLVYCLYILAFLLEQFNMVHAFMMRKLAIDPSEVTASLSVGLSLDHILAITVSAVLGVIWEKFGCRICFLPDCCNVVDADWCGPLYGKTAGKAGNAALK